MPDCYAKGCRSRTCNTRKNRTQLEWEQCHGQKITFHRFPKDPKKRIKWLDIMKLNNTDIPKNAKLCSLHFAESAFDRTYVNCVKIRPDVVPSGNVFRIGASYRKQKDEEINEEINEEIDEENDDPKAVKIHKHRKGEEINEEINEEIDEENDDPKAVKIHKHRKDEEINEENTDPKAIKIHEYQKDKEINEKNIDSPTNKIHEYEKDEINEENIDPQAITIFDTRQDTVQDNSNSNSFNIYGALIRESTLLVL